MAKEDAGEIRRLMEAKWKLALDGDYFGLLAVGRGASSAEVRKAYLLLVKKLHPDRLASHGLEDKKEQSTQLFKTITHAHEVLSDDGQRAQFLAGKLAPEIPGDGAARKASLNLEEAAKIAFHKGTVKLNRREFAEAEDFYHEACEQQPDQARYWQSLGWAIFSHTTAQENGERLDDARKCYEKALEIAEEDPQTHYCMGLYHKHRGDTRRSRRAFERASSLRPGFVEAQRELRLIEMREKKKEEQPQGFLGRMMEKLTKTR